MPRYWARIAKWSSTTKLISPRIRTRPDEAVLHHVKRLPSAYQKFYEEWQTDSTPVHWVPATANFARHPTKGIVSVVRERPIPVFYPHQSEKGLWGGEGVVEGLVKKGKYRCPVPRFWVPVLQRSVVYSEILNKYLGVTVTTRALKLIDEFQGFDSYLLKNPANELKSLLALKLKRRLLLALASRDFCSDNPQKQAELLEKYKTYMIPMEEIEWYGLSVEEAKAKYESELEERHTAKIVPLKVGFRAELLEKLKAEAKMKEESSFKEESQASSGWLNKLNPFSKPEQRP